MASWSWGIIFSYDLSNEMDYMVWIDILSMQFGQRNFTTVQPQTTSPTTPPKTHPTSPAPATTPAPTAIKCNGYHFSDCDDFNPDDLIASIDQIDVEECQMLCADIYSPDCKQFVYDQKMS